jgi:hypothetical protein
MFSLWARLVFESTWLGLEAQRVILLRMIAMAAGGSRAQAEAQRMISEKLFALMRAGQCWRLVDPRLPLFATIDLASEQMSVASHEDSQRLCAAQAVLSENSIRRGFAS